MGSVVDVVVPQVVWAIPKVRSTVPGERKVESGNGAKAKSTAGRSVGALANGFCARRGLVSRRDSCTSQASVPSGVWWCGGE